MAGAERSSALFSIEKHRFSVTSGCLACLGSILGKVAFDGETAFHLLAKSSCRHHLPEWVPCNMVGLAVQATSLAGMFMVNAIMLSTYLKALQTSGSTVAAVTSCAINFLLSGVSGRIVFGEHLPLLWFGGAGLLVCGLLLVVDSSDTNTLGKASRTTGDSKRPKKSAGSSTNIKRD